MNRFKMLIAALGMTAVAVPTLASAAPFQPINVRVDRLQARIDQGVRSGALTRNEATRLRGDLRALTGLEYRYQRSGGGLSGWERQDLDRRFYSLSAKVRVDKHDRQNRQDHRRW